MNIYDILLDAEPSGPEKTSMQANALRGRSDLGMLGIMSRNPALVDVGKNLVSSSRGAAEGLKKTREKAAQRQMTQGYYDTLGQQFDRRQTETERKNLAGEELDAERNRLMAEGKKEKELNKFVERYSKRAEKYQPLVGAMRQIDSLVSPYVAREDGRVRATEDIPGIGRGQTILPNFARSEEGNRIFGRVNELRNIILQIRSGAAVTESEAQRLDAALQLLGTANEQNFLDQYEQARELVDGAMASVSAGYPTEVIETYRARGGITPLGKWNVGDGAAPSNLYEMSEGPSEPWKREW